MTDDNLRLSHIEESLADLKSTAVDREWLEERLGRTEDAIKAYTRESKNARDEIAKDVRELKEDDKARRRAVFTAVVGSLAAITVTLIQMVPL